MTVSTSKSHTTLRAPTITGASAPEPPRYTYMGMQARKQSSARMVNRAASQAATARACCWESTAPRGRPVVPLVNPIA